MTASLERRLSRSIAAAILAFGLVAACLACWSAFEEAEERQDDTLRQIALLTDLPRLPPAGGRILDAADRDPDARVIIERLPVPTAADPLLSLPSGLAPGFHTLELPQGRWRVYVYALRPGESIAAAQDTVSRDEVAFGGALLTLLPLLALIPLLSWLAARIIRRGLQPVRALARQVDAQTPGAPEALPEAHMPEEIMPFLLSINDLLARVRHLLVQQRRFIADAAHELRTPLTALSLQAQNLENADSFDTVRRRLIPLSGGIARARRLVDQLLHLSRQQIDDGTKTGIDLQDTVRDLIDELLPMAASRQIAIRLMAVSNPRVLAEPYPLRQLLRNALDNAVRYSPDGGEVMIELGDEHREAWVRIIDTGPGIPEDERPRVFEPFYRIAGSQGEGSGLGLAIVHDAAARLGGRVSLANRGDQPGLVFSYYQRAEARDASDAALSAQPAHIAPLSASRLRRQ